MGLRPHVEWWDRHSTDKERFEDNRQVYGYDAPPNPQTGDCWLQMSPQRSDLRHFVRSWTYNGAEWESTQLYSTEKTTQGASNTQTFNVTPGIRLDTDTAGVIIYRAFATVRTTSNQTPTARWILEAVAETESGNTTIVSQDLGAYTVNPIVANEWFFVSLVEETEPIVLNFTADLNRVVVKVRKAGAVGSISTNIDIEFKALYGANPIQAAATVPE